MDEVLDEWFEKEAKFVEEALQEAHLYQVVTPDIADYWEDFWDKLERRNGQREDFIKRRKYEAGELPETVHSDHRDVREPDSLSDLFCDQCDSLAFRVGVINDLHVCPSCWEDSDWEEQNQLGNYFTGGTRYALVGCGSSKHQGLMPARELYSSTYFEKKREFAEQLCDEWRIISAKYGLVHPDTLIIDYDASIDDVDINEWMDAVEESLEELDWREGGEVWALIGQRYLDVGSGDGRSLRKLLNRSEPDIYYPFEQTSGIGEQNQWLSACVEEGEAVMPYSLDFQDQSSLSEF